MPDKELMQHRSAASDASVPLDLGMSDATLGAIFRDLLGKLAKSQTVTVVPKDGHQPVSDALEEAARSGTISRSMASHIKNGRRPLGPSVSMRLRIGGFEARITSQHEPDHTTENDAPNAPFGDELEQAIRAAEARGTEVAKSIFDDAEMLSTAEIAEHIGISRQAVAKRRDAGTILALKAGPKALKYPAWQILPTGEVAPRIEDVLRRLEGDVWTAYRLLKEIAPDGTGRPLFELLRAGDVETVLAHIDGVLEGAST
jgi:transcriptional regulator with XRE-family HTH domain